LAVRAPKNRSRRKRLCAVFLRHILRLLVLLRKPLFATAKRQLPRTLNASFAGIKKIKLFIIKFEHNKTKYNFKLF
jgi:hypothetical protein